MEGNRTDVVLCFVGFGPPSEHDADLNFAFLAACLHPGRCGCVVEDSHGVVCLIDETASGFGKPDAARVTVEEEDTKIFLQRTDP